MSLAIRGAGACEVQGLCAVQGLGEGGLEIFSKSKGVPTSKNLARRQHFCGRGFGRQESGDCWTLGVVIG